MDNNKFKQNNLKAYDSLDVDLFVQNLQKNLDRMQHHPDAVQWSEVLEALSHVQERRIIAAGKRLSSKAIFDLKGVMDTLWAYEGGRVMEELDYNRKCAKWIRELKIQNITPQDFGYEEGVEWKLVTDI